MRRVETVGLVILIGAGWGLRLWGMRQGYPEFYGHVDEVGVAASIWNFFRASTLLPTEFTYPAFFSYLVAIGLWMSCLPGQVPFAHDCLDSLVLLSFIDPARSALVGRALSGLAGAATVGITFFLGRSACGKRVAWGGTALVAVAVVPVRQAHMALPDCLMALLAACCFFLAWRIYERGGWPDYLGAGIVAGLVVATKYNGAFTALSIVAAHALRHEARRWREAIRDPRLWGAVAVSIAALFLGSPYLFITPEKYLNLIQYQVSSLDFSLRETTPWWWILRGLVTGEGLVGGLMLGGLIWGMMRREPLDWIFWGAWLPSFLYIGSWTRESLHYLLHFYPLLALGGARLLEGLVIRLCGERMRNRVFSLVLAVLVLPNLVEIVEQDRYLSRVDTRSLAGEWIEKNIPSGSRIAMTWLPYCPRLDLLSTRRSLSERFRGDPAALRRLEAVWNSRPAYGLTNLEIWLKEPVVPEAYRETVDLSDPETRRVFSRGWLSPRQLRRVGVEYLVLPEAAFERYLKNPILAPEGSAAHYHHLKNRTYFSWLIDPENGETEKVASFEPGEQVRGGSIHIFRLLDR